MTTFYIQTQHGRPVGDFGYELLEALAFHAWKNPYSLPFAAELIEVQGDYAWPGPEESVVTGPLTERIVPIGTVEFVHGFMQWQGLTPPPPLNVPPPLQQHGYAGRRVRTGGAEDGRVGEFYKSATRVKAPVGILHPGERLKNDQYQFSEQLEQIEAEFRCFVYKGELLGIHPYSGQIGVFPDVSAIRRMIAAYSGQPVAFTLDVCVTPGGTFVVEVHHFYACGLYGFRRYDRLPYLFSRWYAAFSDQQRANLKTNFE